MMRRGLGLAARSGVARAGGVFSPARAAGVRGLRASAPLRKDEEALGPSFAEKYQLTEPSRYVPLTIAGFGLGSLTGLYHFDGETQLLALWVLFCGTVYSRGGPIIAEMLDETREQIAAEHKKIEEAEIAALKELLEAHKRQTAVFEDMKGMFNVQTQLVEEIVSSSQNRLKRELYKDMIKKLDTIVAQESKMAEELRTEVVAAAKASVEAAYAKDSDGLKAKALDAALAALSSPESSKKDTTVSSLYSKFLKDFDSKVAAANGKEMELSAEDVAACKELAETIARRDGIDASLISIPSKIKLNF